MQMATESQAAYSKHESPGAQSKRERALDFARHISKPAVRRQLQEDRLCEPHQLQQQTQLQQLEQQYMANQQQVAAMFG